MQRFFGRFCQPQDPILGFGDPSKTVHSYLTPQQFTCLTKTGSTEGQDTCVMVRNTLYKSKDYWRMSQEPLQLLEICMLSIRMKENLLSYLIIPLFNPYSGQTWLKAGCFSRFQDFLPGPDQY